MIGHDNVIQLKNVRKTYKAGEVSVPVLRNVNLNIKKGEFAAIMGPSGSGKSTLLNMISCLDIPSSGKILLDGTDISSLNSSELARLRGSKIGFVFQSFNLYPTLTAQENIELPMTILGVNKKERKKRAKDLLDEVGLEERENHLPSQLSGGERQRIAIARALANKPSLILADEPTGNLDTKTGDDIMRNFERLHKDNGITIVMVTHEKNIAAYAERIINLKDGKIVRGS